MNDRAERFEWFLALLGAAPFLAIYLFHYVALGESSTGFVLYDMASYPAHGREIFERGNSWLYPNSYDCEGSAPAIYFYLVPFFLGYLVHFLGVDPGICFVILGVVAGILFSRGTLSLVRYMLPGSSSLSFLCAMWGGGVFALATIVSRIFGSHIFGDVDFTEMLWKEAGGAWWFFSWGRNIVFSTEAFYHLLAVFVWLCIARSRWVLAIGGICAMALSTPWTGIQLLLSLIGWIVASRFFAKNEKVPLYFTLSIVIIFIPFLWYNLFYLKSIPAHRELSQLWSLNWGYSGATAFLAYLPVALFAALSVWRSRCRLTSLQLLFLSTALVSFALENHDLLVAPMQPFHFTRGYLWFSLLMLGLPELERLMSVTFLRFRNGAIRLFSAAIFLCLVSADNISFLVTHARDMQTHVALDPDLRKLYRAIDQMGLEGSLMCQAMQNSYLAATYTRLCPYVGQAFLTPNYLAHRSHSKEWFESGAATEWLQEVSFVLLDKADWPKWLPSGQNPDGWIRVLENERWILISNAKVR